MKLFITLIFAFFVAVNAQDSSSEEEGTNQVSFSNKNTIKAKLNLPLDFSFKLEFIIMPFVQTQLAL